MTDAKPPGGRLVSKWTVTRFRALKGREKIACVTAYDFTTARLADGVGLPLLLVGDSLAMTMLGYSTTLPVTLDEMLHHTRAVARGVTRALVVADMPFLSYHASIDEAVLHAGRFLKEAGADAVKIEGGRFRAELVGRLVANGIPVLGHIGLTPQSIRATGGYKIQGRRPAEARRLLADARALDRAGVFGLVLECVPKALAGDITKAVGVPTIGIGAGPLCDGQILVIHDLLGLHAGEPPALTFVKRYADLGDAVSRALAAYRDDVVTGRFPADRHSF